MIREGKYKRMEDGEAKDEEEEMEELRRGGRRDGNARNKKRKM